MAEENYTSPQSNQPPGGDAASAARPAPDVSDAAEVEAAAAGAESPTEQREGDIAEIMAKELEAERARAAEYLDQAQRARAELVNYRRRTDQEMQQARQFASERVITRLLPVLDDFSRALDAVPEDERESSWVQGVRMIQRKLWAVLEAEGLRPIESLGQRFDPSQHEAVTLDQDGDGADTVVEEFQRGYMLHDRVIRPAMVKVGRARTAQAAREPATEKAGSDEGKQ